MPAPDVFPYGIQGIGLPGMPGVVGIGSSSSPGVTAAGLYGENPYGGYLLELGRGSYGGSGSDQLTVDYNGNLFSTGNILIQGTTNASQFIANGYGVIAWSSQVNGIAVTGSGYIGLLGRTSTAAGYPLDLENDVSTQVLYVDSSGNVFTNGTVMPLVSTGGGVGRTFVPESTMRTIEDFGSAAIVNGSGTVNLDPSFARMTDGGTYQVFLTPDGDSKGLYVAQKTPNSFIVRESQGGHSSLAFDYRIVAKQYGHSADRASIAASAAAFDAPQPRITMPYPMQKVSH